MALWSVSSCQIPGISSLKPVSVCPMEWIVHVYAVCPWHIDIRHYIIYVVWLYGDMIIRLMSPQLFLKWVSISDFLFQFLSPWEMSNFISAQMSPPPLPGLQTHSCCSSLQNTSHTLSSTDRVCVWQTLMIEFHTSQWLRVCIVSIIPARCLLCLMFEYSSQSAAILAEIYVMEEVTNDGNWPN